MFIKYTILSILILAFSNFNIVSGQYKEKGNEKTNEIEVERLVRYMTRQRRIELLNDLRIKKEYSLTNNVKDYIRPYTYYGEYSDRILFEKYKNEIDKKIDLIMKDKQDLKGTFVKIITEKIVDKLGETIHDAILLALIIQICDNDDGICKTIKLIYLIDKEGINCDFKNTNEKTNNALYIKHYGVIKAYNILKQCLSKYGGKWYGEEIPDFNIGEIFKDEINGQPLNLKPIKINFLLLIKMMQQNK